MERSKSAFPQQLEFLLKLEWAVGGQGSNEAVRGDLLEMAAALARLLTEEGVRVIHIWVSPHKHQRACL